MAREYFRKFYLFLDYWKKIGTLHTLNELPGGNGASLWGHIQSDHQKNSSDLYTNTLIVRKVLINELVMITFNLLVVVGGTHLSELHQIIAMQRGFKFLALGPDFAKPTFLRDPCPTLTGSMSFSNCFSHFHFAISIDSLESVLNLIWEQRDNLTYLGLIVKDHNQENKNLLSKMVSTIAHCRQLTSLTFSPGTNCCTPQVFAIELEDKKYSNSWSNLQRLTCARLEYHVANSLLEASRPFPHHTHVLPLLFILQVYAFGSHDSETHRTPIFPRIMEEHPWRSICPYLLSISIIPNKKMASQDFQVQREWATAFEQTMRNRQSIA